MTVCLFVDSWATSYAAVRDNEHSAAWTAQRYSAPSIVIDKYRPLRAAAQSALWRFTRTTPVSVTALSQIARRILYCTAAKLGADLLASAQLINVIRLRYKLTSNCSRCINCQTRDTCNVTQLTIMSCLLSWVSRNYCFQRALWRCNSSGVHECSYHQNIVW